MEEEKYMQRCIELARNGLCNVSPNPMVGAVIVHNGRIIGAALLFEKFPVPVR